ncbi:hypothetical protein ANCDUO_01875 [Ancylostoma duodenale]|uniref:7TM GPCR serpentine receptor class x (Srx) domain-containing protein n=1 Tax=Ancylostoma duodenale TaxID=51022 RepID=A0A0C2H886_9BILA|nr:hypothetical protein ANCDUO_01875 [Ancylostoma duodenale]
MGKTKCRFVYNPEDLSWVYQGCPRKKTGYGTNESERRRNVKLFWQGFAQELFFANDLIWQDFFLTLINTRLWWFVSNTLMWELAHICDGPMVSNVMREHLMVLIVRHP